MRERTGGRKGTADKMMGKAKEMVGKVTGDERLRGEGRTDQSKGKAKEAMDVVKENLHGARDSLKGKSRRKH
ncbi:CsbD family protein [Streptomyces sp. NPDC004647]|uniref:CsbD family protein n=1 Tax=Streptomyces sp. NPDC004647 TaxID=3154671 RepID=UPI0033BC5869